MERQQKKVFPKWNVVKTTKSPVEGVDLLRDGKGSNYVTVREQRYDKLQEDYGNLANFIETGQRWEPEAPDKDAINDRYEDAPVKVKDSIYSSKILEYEKQLTKLEDSHAKVFGTIRRILDPTVRDRVKRSVGYTEAKQKRFI